MEFKYILLMVLALGGMFVISLSFLNNGDLSFNFTDTEKVKGVTEFATVNETDVISAYHFDETSGSTADNAEGTSAYDGTISGCTINQTGKLDKAYDFDGDNDYVSIPESMLTSQSSGSISLWIKPDDVSESYSLITLGGSSNTQYYGITSLQLRPDAIVRFISRDEGDSTPDAVDSGTTTLTAGNWYHIVITSDGSEWVLYVNGVDVTNTILNNNSGLWFDISVSGTKQINIGASYADGSFSSAYYNGLMDEVIFFDKTLTSTEVSDLYNSGNGLAYPFESGEPPAETNCTYSGSGNWELNLSHYCIINATSNLGTNNITFTGTGNITFNATITACNIAGLPSNEKGYIGSNAQVNIGGCS